jgi:hypothetical protein
MASDSSNYDSRVIITAEVLAASAVVTSVTTSTSLPDSDAPPS